MDQRITITEEWAVRLDTREIVACDSEAEARAMAAEMADGELVVRKVYETTWADQPCLGDGSYSEQPVMKDQGKAD